MEKLSTNIISINPVVKLKLMGANEVLDLYNKINKNLKETSDLIDELVSKMSDLKLTAEEFH